MSAGSVFMCHPFGMNLMYLFLCGLRNLSFVDVYVIFTCCLADSSGTIFSLLNAVHVHSKISFVHGGVFNDGCNSASSV